MAVVLSSAEAVEELCKRVSRLKERLPTQQRGIIVLAGVPGSGKSTISQAVMLRLAELGICDINALPLDGYHYTKSVLATFADPLEAFKRRGAPFTFDAAAFLDTILTVSVTPMTSSKDAKPFLCAPGFDHAAQDPVPGSVPILSDARMVIVEGNYTLLDEEPWRTIASLADERWFVDAPRELVRLRLARRHMAAGIEKDVKAALLRAEENDLPNGDLIRRKLIEPDVVIHC